jgi:CBS domain-containing protein
LPVVDEDHKLLGIITEADFLDLVIRALEDAERN